MLNYKLSNNVVTTLAENITASATTIILNKATSPYNDPVAPEAGETALLTIIDDTIRPAKIEIIKFTGITDNGTTLTITGVSRNQEDSGACAFSADAIVTQSTTKGFYDNIQSTLISLTGDVDDNTVSITNLESNVASLSGDINDILAGSVFSVFGRDGIVTAQTNDYTWAQINKTTSDIADITIKSHTSLSDIGTKTHDLLESDIESLSADIATNTADISNNITNIESLSADIATNTADISNNITNIESLSADIATNTVDIATNTADISNNITDIESLSGEYAIGNEKGPIYNPSLSADNSYSGTTFIDRVGESVVFGDTLYKDKTENRWKKTDPQQINTMPCATMALETAITNDEILLLLDGVARNDDWNWSETDTNQILYVGTDPGTMSESPVISGGYHSQAIAHILDSKIILFRPSFAMAVVAEN